MSKTDISEITYYIQSLMGDPWTDFYKSMLLQCRHITNNLSIAYPITDILGFILSVTSQGLMANDTIHNRTREADAASLLRAVITDHASALEG